MDQSASRTRPRRFALAATVLLVQAALVAVIYPSPARFGFVADAWGYIVMMRDGLGSMLSQPIGYHWQPIAYLFIDLMRRVLGESPGSFQALNLAQLVSIGFLAFLLGRRASGDAGVGFVASLLYLGSASYYEATYWPLAGNMHLLSAQLYLVTLLLAWEVGAGRLVRAGPWLAAGSALAAVFTHPAMATVVPLAALTIVLVARERGERWGRGGRRLALVLLALVALVVVAGRLIVQAIVGGDMPPTSVGRMGLLSVAVLTADMMLLRGSIDVGFNVVAFGPGASMDATRLWLGVAAWTCVPLALLAWGVRAARTAGFAVVAAFFVLHVYALGLGGALSSRQTILAQVPVALLAAWALQALAQRAAGWIGEPAGAATLRMLPAVIALFLVIGAVPDHRRAARLSIQAGATSMDLYRGIQAAVPPGETGRGVLLVNAPWVVLERGMGSMVFRNGPYQILTLASPPGTRLEFGDMPLPDMLPLRMPTDAITAPHLRARVRDPAWVVFVFHQPPRLVRRVTAENVEDVVAGR